MSMVRWFFVVVIAMLVGFFIYVDMNNDVPEGLGVVEGKLSTCPDMPNCVSSQADINDEEHYIDPIIHKKNAKEVQLQVERFLLEQGNARILDSRLGYTHFELESSIFGFKDDLELYFPEADSVMHLRSASRVGYDDLDANRERVRQIRKLLVDSM